MTLAGGIRRIARSYAQALLDVAIQQNRDEQVYKDLQHLAQVFQESPELRAFFRNPVIPEYRKREVLERVVKPRVDPLTWTFLEIVLRRNRVLWLSTIFEEYERTFYHTRGWIAVEIDVPVHPDPEMEASFREELSRILQKSPDALVLRFHVQEELIGGFRLQIDGRMLDRSVRFALNQLRRRLQKGEQVYEIQF